MNETDLPDVKRVLPLLKSRVLENVVISFSGVVPTGYDLKKQRCYLMATSLGARVNEELVLPSSSSGGEEGAIVERGHLRAKKYEYSYDEDEETNSSSSGAADFKSSNESIVDDNNSSSQMPEASAAAAASGSSKTRRFTTHLVAAKYGTCKVHEALKAKPPIRVVTPEWLINSNFKWIKCDENQYKLTKDYDYRSCVFHEEYQKYSANNAPQQAAALLDETKAKGFTFSKLIDKAENVDESSSSAVTGTDAAKKSWIKNESSNSLSSFQSKTKKQKSSEG